MLIVVHTVCVAVLAMPMLGGLSALGGDLITGLWLEPELKSESIYRIYKVRLKTRASFKAGLGLG